eukprot:TRINITY_DN1885_c0_g1_i1.p1 TRINITY_DN1885_c0_g1~~TRINITY_DN1885_c0_g1_i1.p1  ORF type:complete len:482 (+),score=114.87 TRINITY_DN1885_c0_g1_i1:68-1513(+)
MMRCATLAAAFVALLLPELLAAIELGHLAQSKAAFRSHDAAVVRGPLRMWPSVGPFKCNGRADVCNLLFDEVTLLGSHNTPAYDFSLAGFSSSMVNCAYADHSADAVKQLKRGVRFFDYDTCLRGGEIHACHGQGALARVKGLLRPQLQAMADWLKENPREVVMISFGDHDPAPRDTPEVAEKIAKILKEVFDDDGLALQTEDVVRMKRKRAQWPTLGSMVTTGRRVVLAFEGDPRWKEKNLFEHVPTMAKSFIFNLYDDFEYTWGKANSADDYEELLRHLKFYCEDNEEWLSYYFKAVQLDAFMTLQLKVRGPAREGKHRIERNAGVAQFHALDKPREVFEEPSLPDDFLTKLQQLNATANASRGDCVCTHCLAQQFNEASTRQRGKRNTSTLFEAQRLCRKLELRVHVVKVDFEEHGQMFQTVDAMNDENVKHFCPHCTLDFARLMPEMPNLLPGSGTRSGRACAMLVALMYIVFSGCF